MKALNYLIYASLLAVTTGCAQLPSQPAAHTPAANDTRVGDQDQLLPFPDGPLLTTADTPLASALDNAPPPRGMTPDTLYALLVAEIAGQRNQLDIALENYLEQAAKTQDAGVAERATHIAQYMGASQEAADAAALWSDLEPDNANAQQTAAQLLAQTGRFSEAFERLARLQERGHAANFPLIAGNAGNLSTTEREPLIELLNQLRERFPDTPQLLTSLAILHQQNSDYGTALQLIQRALELQPDYPRAQALQASLLHQQGRTPEALALLRKQLEATPLNYHLRVLLARILIDAGELHQAQQEFTTLVEQRPNDGRLILSLALVYMENNLLEEAKQNLQRLLALRQYSNQAHYYLGRLAEQQADTETALNHYWQIGPGDEFIAAQTRATTLLVRLDRLEEARQGLQESRAQHPEYALPLYLFEAELLQELELDSQAMRLLVEALTDHPGDINLLYARAMLALKQENLVLMEADLRNILEQQPNNATVLNALGYTLTDRTDRHHEALLLIRKAHALKPDDPAITDSLGWVQFRLGHYEEAIELLQQAYDMLPDEEIASHLAEALWHNGQTQQARQLVEKTLTESPDGQLIHQLLERIPELRP